MRKLIIVLLLVALLAGCAKPPEPTPTPEPTATNTPEPLKCTFENIRASHDGIEQIFLDTIGSTYADTPKDEMDNLYAEMFEQIEALDTPACFDKAKELFVLTRETTRKYFEPGLGDDEKTLVRADLFIYEQRYSDELDRLYNCAPHCD